MANRLGTNPMYIDTAGASVLRYDKLKVREFQFINYDADTDTAVVHDKDGRLIWQGNGNSDLSPVSGGGNGGWVEGIIVPTLDAGVLLVFLE